MSNNLSPTRRLVLLRGALLALAVLAPLGFLLSYLVLVVAGLPASVVCAAAWAGYSAVARKSRQSSR
jgi:hypothetical protein